MYRRGFVEAFQKMHTFTPKCTRLDFNDLAWRDKEGYILIDTFKYMAANDCLPPKGVWFDFAVDGVPAASGYHLSQGIANDFSPKVYRLLHQVAQDVGLKLHDEYEENVRRQQFYPLGNIRSTSCIF